MIVALSGAGLLLLLAPVAVVIGKHKNANAVLYGVCCAVSLVLLVCAATHLLGRAPAATLRLPLGLPWVGSHLRLDALSAFFLIVVNLGAAAASLFAIGYGARERADARAPILSRLFGRDESRLSRG